MLIYKKISFFVIILCFLNSCVGYEAVYREEVESNNIPAFHLMGPEYKSYMIDLKDKEEIMKLMGHKLKYDETKDGYEYFSYRDSLATAYSKPVGFLRKLEFYGVVLYAVVPIPLLVPIGFDGGNLVFKDGKFIKSTRRVRKHDYATICSALIPFFNPSCHHIFGKKNKDLVVTGNN